MVVQRGSPVNDSEEHDQSVTNPLLEGGEPEIVFGNRYLISKFFSYECSGSPLKHL